MIKHSSYFEDGVQSLAFTRNDLRSSVGVMAPGTYRFDTAEAERMNVISGELKVKRDGEETWTTYAAGTYFEIGAKSFFDVTATGTSSYLCEYHKA